jgi:hypothetical protein
MILHLKDLIDSTRRLITPIKTFSKVAVHKINIQKSVTFLYTKNKLDEKEVRDTILFTIASKTKQKTPKHKLNPRC